MTGRDAREALEACLWDALQLRLTEWNPAWRERVGGAASIARLARRQRGVQFRDEEIFEGLLLSVLSGNTQWSTVERIQPELSEAFDGFSLRAYAGRSEAEIAALLPWFAERRAGSTRLKASLLRLRDTASRLEGYGRGHGGAESYFRDALEAVGGEPEKLAVALGSSKQWKLAGFGVALAAEALRNIGFDLCKPDRHVSRAVASWGLVEFGTWDTRSDFTAPAASVAELYRTMCAVRSFASANGLGVSYATSAIWIAGAVSGARLTNSELASLLASCSDGASGQDI